ncbi:MAG: VWA domain-containing protein, partial [Clostridia bacterium]|nr:VWA domain-containing protein [Clostridia bacterium]
MANKMKRMLGMLLAVCMLFGMMNASAFSEENITAKKSSALQNRDENRYGIEIQVPGKDGDNRHDEVILMVDGSYSMDNEWPAMKEAINTIGEAVLNGSGNTQLTLMAFGMGDNIVLKHTKSASDLAASLGALPGNLLYGRSSTNCEAGFTGVAEYIANHDSSLKDAYVIFISDGRVNTDETPRAFDANWQTWTKFGALTVAQQTFGGTVSNGKNLPAAFTTVFGNRFDGATREEIMERAFGGEVTDEEFITFAEQVWTDVYAYSDLERGEAYPVSDAESAFVKYDKENGT